LFSFLCMNSVNAFKLARSSELTSCLTASLSGDQIHIDQDSNLLEFKKWCTQKNIISPLDVKIRKGKDNYRFMEYSDDGELFANRPEKINGPILRVPLSVCIVASTPEDLALELEKERDLGVNSAFAPYIKVLPNLLSSSLQSMPRFWSDETLHKVSEFDGGQIYQRVEIVKTTCKERNLDDWALACVNSRANFIGDGFAMTPVLDFLNHNSLSKTTAKILERELFLSVENKYQKVEEVFISYGDFTNLETLCDYGFVDDSNGCNKEYVDVFIIRQNPVRVTISGDTGMLNPGSLALLRSYLAPQEDVEQLLVNDETLSSNSVYARPISDALEEDVYSLVASFVYEAICNAKNGIHWVGKEGKEGGMIERYLSWRIATLSKCLSFIKEKFPDILY